VHRALVLLIALLFALLPGCAEPPRGVVVWHPYRGGEQKALEKIAADWEETSGTKVTLLSVPYEAYLAKLEAAIPRGNGPDVFVSPHNRLGEYLLHILVAPIGDAPGKSDDAVHHGGKQWGIALSSKCPALYVNTDLMPTPPATFGEITKAKTALPAGTWPIVYESQSVYYHVAFLHAFGGEFFAEGEFKMVGPEAVRSLEFVRDLTTAGIVPDEPSGDLVKQLFAQKKAATAISGPWLAPDLPPDLHYTVVPLPTIDGAGVMKPYLTVDAAFLTPEGSKSPTARSFAAFLGERGSTPPSPACANAIPMPVSSAMNPAWDPALQAMRKVLRGSAVPGPALEDCAGVAGGTYLFALPGSPGACRDGWDGILAGQLDVRHRPCNFVEIMPRLEEHRRRK
jgi:maltose-binding protein MalE